MSNYGQNQGQQQTQQGGAFQRRDGQASDRQRFRQGGDQPRERQETEIKWPAGAPWMEGAPRQGAVHRFRLLPLINDDGTEAPCFRPDIKVGDLNAVYGPALQPVEMMTIYKNHVREHVLTNLQPVTRTGEPFTEAYRTPAAIVVGKLSRYATVAKYKLERGYPTQVPEAWQRMWNDERNRFVNSQPDFYLVGQGLVYMQSNQNLDGSPKIIRFKAEIMDTQFVTPLKTPIGLLRMPNPGEPLTADLIQPQYWITSSQNGYLITMSSQADKGRPIPGSRGGFNSTYTTAFTNPMPLSAEQARQFFRPWNQVLPLPFVEDAIAYLLGLFGPQLVAFSLAGTPYKRFLPQEMLDAVAGMQLDPEFPNEVKKWDRCQAAAPAQPQQQVAPVITAPYPNAAPMAPAPATAFVAPQVPQIPQAPPLIGGQPLQNAHVVDRQVTAVKLPDVRPPVAAGQAAGQPWANVPSAPAGVPQVPQIPNVAPATGGIKVPPPPGFAAQAPAADLAPRPVLPHEGPPSVQQY